MPLSFSIVICTYNQSATLGHTLQSLQYLRHPRFEVIVVNGPSTDQTDTVLAPYLPTIRLTHCEKVNLSKACNIGLAMAQGDIVCFIDGATLPEPDWLNELEAGYTTASIGAVGGYILDHTGVQFQSKVKVSDRFGREQHFETLEAAQPSCTLSTNDFPAHYLCVPKNNASYRCNLLRAFGGFDEQCSGALNHADSSLRLIEAGHQITYRPHAEVRDASTSSNQVDYFKYIPESAYLAAYNAAYFSIKQANTKISQKTLFSRIELHKKEYKKKCTRAFLTFQLKFFEWRALLKSIDQGSHDGLEYALRLAKTTTPTQIPVEGSDTDFKEFPVLLAAAKRLHIGIVWQLYPPQKSGGGIIVWIHELATGLARLGHEVTVITHVKKQPHVEFKEGVWVRRTVKPRAKNLCTSLNFLKNRTTPFIPRIRRKIRRGLYKTFDEVMRVHERRKLDIICSPICGMEGIPFISDGTIPTVISLHSCWKFIAESKSEEKKKRLYSQKKFQDLIRAEEWTFLQATHLLANSKAIARDIEQLYGLNLSPERVTVIPHGIKDHRVGMTTNTERTTTHTPPSKNHPLHILCVGRLEERKGTDVLLAALPTLLVRYPTVEVHIVGDNALSNDGNNYKEHFLAEYAQASWLNRVHFEGVVSDSTLHTLYQQADIFVAPSRYESFGLMYVEAMIFDTPCIGTDVGGVPEVITHNENGLLVPVNDVEKLSEALSRLIEDAPLRQKLGQQGRMRYEAEFTEDLMAKRIAALLHKVAKCEKILNT